MKKRLKRLFCKHKRKLIEESVSRDLYKNPYLNCTTSYRYETLIIEECEKCEKYRYRTWTSDIEI